VSQFLVDMLATADAEQLGRLILGDLEERIGESAVDRGATPEAATAIFRDLTRGISGTQAGRRLIDDAILSRAAAAIADRFGDEPRVAGRLEHTLAETYERFGLYEPAMQHARRAVSVREATVGGEAPETLRSRALIGLLQYRKGEFSEAEDVLRGTLDHQRVLLGEDHGDVFWTSVRLSWVLIEQGQFADAEALLKDVLARQRLLLGDEHRDTATTMNSLAVVYADQQRYAEAEALHSEVLAIRNRVLGPDDPDTLKSMTNLAVVAFYQGRFDDAGALFENVLDIQIQTLGPDHPVTLGSANNLAVIYERQGRLAEAEALHRRALDAKIRGLGDDHPETLSSRYNLAILMTAQGHLEEADELHRQILEARRRVLGRDHPSTVDSICAVAGVAALRGDRERALRALEEAVELGYRDAELLRRDADFESLRDDPRFLGLIDRVLRNAAAGAAKTPS
jgi:tetratricopeptide (TPR) repeat protein